jgi:hypothetical protein
MVTNIELKNHVRMGLRVKTSMYDLIPISLKAGISGGLRESTLEDGNTDVTIIQYNGNNTIAAMIRVPVRRNISILVFLFISCHLEELSF